MKQITILTVSTLFFLLFSWKAQAQIGINTDNSNPDASAMLDVKSTTKGVLTPRMTAAQKTAIATPANGLLIYQTDAAVGFWYFDGTWKALSSSGWNLTGNVGTNGTNFIGTTDNQSLNFRVNNVQSGKIDNSLTATFFGYNAGAATTEINNTAFGHSALVGNTTGKENVAIGVNALFTNTTSEENIAIGNQALYTTNANANIAIGHRALQFNSTGTNNLAIGSYALNPTTGSNNVAVGRGAGNFNNGGSNNTCIGYEANLGNPGSSFTNAIAIGATTYVNASNKVRMGNTAITVAEIQVPWTITSDKNAKKDILYDALGLDFINELQPATYRYKTHDESAPRYTGLLAQDVEAILKKRGVESSIVTKPNADGTGSWGVRYSELAMPLINAVQELSEENETLKAKVAQLEIQISEINQLKAEVDEIKALLQANATK